ncbi:hypothetical protein QZH41_007810 [Actinostola sp. cb2023]|nr:hypothetical protein QZH41_007810 [Actinostola sp. cb2023]
MHARSRRDSNLINEVECSSALGMKSGKIRNSYITASSEYGSGGHVAWRARLDNYPAMPYNVAIDVGCWSAASNQVGQYLQVDIGVITYVTMVATQGRPYHGDHQYVTKYKLSYKNNNNVFVEYQVNGGVKDIDMLEAFINQSGGEIKKIKRDRNRRKPAPRPTATATATINSDMDGITLGADHDERPHEFNAINYVHFFSVLTGHLTVLFIVATVQVFEDGRIVVAEVFFYPVVELKGVESIIGDGDSKVKQREGRAFTCLGRFFNVEFESRVYVVHGMVEFICEFFIAGLEIDIVYISFVWLDILEPMEPFKCPSTSTPSKNKIPFASEVFESPIKDGDKTVSIRIENDSVIIMESRDYDTDSNSSSRSTDNEITLSAFFDEEETLSATENYQSNSFY